MITVNDAFYISDDYHGVVVVVVVVMMMMMKKKIVNTNPSKFWTLYVG